MKPETEEHIYTCERVKEAVNRPETRPDPRTWPDCLSRFRPPHRSSKVSIGSPWDADYTPAVITAHRRRFKFEKSQPKLITTAVDSTGIWPCHHLSFVPHDSLFNSRLSTTTGSHCFAASQLLEFRGCWAKFWCRHRALEFTVGTTELSVAKSV